MKLSLFLSQHPSDDGKYEGHILNTFIGLCISPCFPWTSFSLTLKSFKFATCSTFDKFSSWALHCLCDCIYVLGWVHMAGSLRVIALSLRKSRIQDLISDGTFCLILSFLVKLTSNLANKVKLFESKRVLLLWNQNNKWYSICLENL